jgi:hypothetical protein
MTNPNTLAGRFRTACAARLLPLLLLTLPAAMQAQDYLYTTNADNTITIGWYIGSGGDVTIPDTIDGLPVTSIGDEAFFDCEVLTSVIIGTNVTSIGWSAFDTCISLTSITIPNSVTIIGGTAFEYCSSLTNVTIGNGVTSIEWAAFYECTSLAGVYFHGNAPAIDSDVFYDDNATVYYLSGTTGWGTSFGGRPVVLMPYTHTNDNGTITITGYTGSGGGLTIPGTIDGLPVTSIGNSAFSNKTSLIAVTIPNSVTNIGTHAFDSCTTLNNVTIGNSVTNIGDFSFYNCTNLMGVYFQCNVPGIGLSVFDGDNNVTIFYSPGTTGWGATFGGRPVRFGSPATQFNYTISNSTISITGYTGPGGSVAIPDTINGLPVTRIGGYAFYHCASPTSVMIPNSVSSIGSYAFYSCYSMTSITIGTGVTSIEPYAFYNCTSLIAIQVDALNSVYSSVNGVLFNTSTNALIECPWGKAGSYTVPDSVTSIGGTSFFYCTRLTSVTIPNSVTSIGVAAFEHCTSLTNVMIGNSVTSIGAYAFYQCTSLTNVMIPNSVTNIDGYAFIGCNNLTVVYFQGNAPGIGLSLFGGDNNATIYYLPGTTGWENFSQLSGLPIALWKPRVQISDASFGVRTNQFGFNINWASGQVVVVEACTNVANAVWQPLQTNTLTGGSCYFSDPDWTNYLARLYRLRSP